MIGARPACQSATPRATRSEVSSVSPSGATNGPESTTMAAASGKGVGVGVGGDVGRRPDKGCGGRARCQGQTAAQESRVMRRC